MRPRANLIRQQRVERTRRLPDPATTEPEVDSYFDAFDRLTDDFVDNSRSFGEAVKRLEIALAGRCDLFPADLNEEGARLCDEIEVADKAIVDCCKGYCATWPDRFGRVTSPALRRRVADATTQLKALIPALHAHTARLSAFLESVPRLLN